MSDEQSYKQGFIDGITAYAWYKDGVQHVGTTGKTLHEAVAHVEKTWNYNPPASPQGAQERETRLNHAAILERARAIVADYANDATLEKPTLRRGITDELLMAQEIIWLREFRSDPLKKLYNICHALEEPDGPRAYTKEERDLFIEENARLSKENTDLERRLRARALATKGTGVKPPTVKLVYNKTTKRIDKVRTNDGLVLESFEPPCDYYRED